MVESSSQVDSDPAVAASPTNQIKNGKRGAEEVVEPQVVGSKKQKIVNDDVEKKNSGMETESIKEEQHRSSEEHQEQNKVEVPSSLKSVTTTQDRTKARSSNDCEQGDKDDDNSKKENEQHLENQKKCIEVPPTTKSAATEDDAERVSISNEYKEEERVDPSKKGNQRLGTPKKNALKLNNELLLDHQVRLDSAMERAEHPTGSKRLYLGNLSFSIEEDDVRDFFKNVGEIAEIRFAIRDDRFLGYGHIEFTTAEAAQEALKLNKEVLLDRRVKLDFARQRSLYTPLGNSMDNSNQRGGHAQGKTIYVRGFDSSDGFDNIRSALEKHFGKCGEISRMSIPKDYDSGAPKGIAFIEFADSNGFSQALGLDGSEFEVGGRRLTVEEAKNHRGYGDCGFSGGWSGSGAWVRERSYGRESGSRRESGSGIGWRRESGYSRDGDNENGYGFGGGWGSRRFGSGYGGGWGSGRGSNGNWLSSSNVGGGSGSNGNGYSSSSRVGSFSGSRRGGRPTRP